MVVNRNRFFAETPKAETAWCQKLEFQLKPQFRPKWLFWPKFGCFGQNLVVLVVPYFGRKSRNGQNTKIPEIRNTKNWNQTETSFGFTTTSTPYFCTKKPKKSPKSPKPEISPARVLTTKKTLGAWSPGHGGLKPGPDRANPSWDHWRIGHTYLDWAYKANFTSNQSRARLW